MSGEETRTAGEVAVWEQLEKVIEPEVGVPITALGLIYGVDLGNGGKFAHIRMTLTSPACPVAPYLMELVRTAAIQAEDIEDAEVELVWDPPWDPDLITDDDVREELGLD